MGIHEPSWIEHIELYLKKISLLLSGHFLCSLLRVPSPLQYLDFNFLAFNSQFCVGSIICLYVRYLSVAVRVGGRMLSELSWQQETHFSNLVVGYQLLLYKSIR